MEAIRTVPVDAKPPRGFDATLFDLLPDAVLYATCPGFAVRDANAACLRLFGLTRAQLLAGAGPDLGLGEDQLAALLRGEPVSLERTLRLGEGAALPAHLTLTPTGPFKGEPVGVVIVVRDLAERKRFEAVLQNAPAQILTIDRKGRILTLNRSVRGAEAAGLVGIDAYSTVAEEDRERVRALVEGAMLTGQPVEYETRAVLAPGVERWFHVRVAALGPDGGGGAVLISTDVTRRRRDEAEMALLRAQLARGEKLSALGGLVSGVAHELRTPLTFLANNAFLAQRRLDRAARRGATAKEAFDETAPLFAEITAGVDRINQLVEDLRRYTKARQDETLAPAPLDSLVAEAVELFRATSRGRHPVETSLSRTPPVLANRGAVQQVVLNLLQNGADASPPGAPLRVVTREEEGRAILEVADRGAGISPEGMRRIYEPLYTTKEEGTGLGLTIVKRIVDEHEAEIACESEPGRGTRFRIAFPAQGRNWERSVMTRGAEGGLHP